jgi:hypothetical protein
MKLQQAIDSFHKLGEEIEQYLKSPASYPDWEAAIASSQAQNQWFTRENILYTLEHISPWLKKDALETWLSRHHVPGENKKPLSVSVIMAGNIPLVGFHDMLCVLLTGNKLLAKLSHTDTVLMNLIAQKLADIEPAWKGKLQFADKLSTSADAVIATGSNNSAKHFEYYFKSVPHIIRRNRNGVAVLDGKEAENELAALGEDIFTYFGLGCRNVSKLYVPEKYDFASFFRAIEKYGPVINHNAYANNYLYNRTIYLMDGKVFTDNNFLLVIENPAMASPIAVVHFEYYKDLKALGKTLLAEYENIQCIAASTEVKKELHLHTPIPIVGLGQTQSPRLDDYADGVDVIKFLSEQNKQA